MINMCSSRRRNVATNRCNTVTSPPANAKGPSKKTGKNISPLNHALSVPSLKHCTRARTHTHAHTRACAHAHMRTHTHTHAHPHACTRTHTNTHTRTYVHTHMRIHTHTLLWWKGWDKMFMSSLYGNPSHTQPLWFSYFDVFWIFCRLTGPAYKTVTAETVISLITPRNMPASFLLAPLLILTSLQKWSRLGSGSRFILQFQEGPGQRSGETCC